MIIIQKTERILTNQKSKFQSFCWNVLSQLVRVFFFVAIITAAASSVAHAQEAKGTWDVTKPRGKTRQIDFTTTEGTWMSVDVSPDGRWLVFDLLG